MRAGMRWRCGWGVVTTACVMGVMAGRAADVGAVASIKRLELVYPGRTPVAGMRLADAPPAVIAPAEFMDTARALADALRARCGVAPELIADTDAVDGYALGLKAPLRARPLIILGNLEQNQVVFQLYARFLVSVDARNPGAGGRVLSYIPNYYQPGNNIMVVAGSTPADTRAAAALFIERLARLPADADDLSWLAGGVDAAGKEQPGRLSDAAFGKAAAAAAKALLPLASSVTSDHHYGMDLPARAWDEVARDGRADPALVREVDQELLNYLVRWEDAWWRRKETHPAFASNRHHVYGTWGYWKIAELLYNALPHADRASPAGRYLTARMDECVRWLLACGLQHDMSVLSLGEFANNTCFLLAAAQTGQMDVFASGRALRMARLACGANDNVNQRIGTSGYEDTYPGMWNQPYPVGAVIPMAAFYYRDPQLQWILENWKPPIHTWWNLATPDRAYARAGVEAATPADLLGFQPLLGAPETPQFVSFRRQFDRDSLFLFLIAAGMPDNDEGDSGKSFQVYPNMLARMSWRGRAWLVCNANEETPWYRNMLTIDSEHGAGTPGRPMRILTNRMTDDAAFFAGCSADHAGTDWTRSVIVAGDEFMVVEDKVQAHAAGHYTLVATWRSPHPGVQKPDNAVEFQANGVTLTLRPAAATPITIMAERVPTKEGSLRPFVVRQHLACPLAAREQAALHNLFFPSGSDRQSGSDRPSGSDRQSGSDRPADYQIRKLTEHASLIRDTRSGVIYLAGFAPFNSHDLVMDAAMFLADSTGKFTASDASAHAMLRGRPLDAAGWQAVLTELWDAARPASPPAGPAGAAKLAPVYAWRNTNDFATMPVRLAGFEWEVPSGVKNSDCMFDGELDRSGATIWPKDQPAEVTIDFGRPTAIAALKIWRGHDGDKGQYRQFMTNPPPAVTPVELRDADAAADAAPLASQTSFDWTLDETYKGRPTTFSGLRVACTATVTRLRLRLPVRQAHEIEIYGPPAGPARALDAVCCTLFEPGARQWLIRTAANDVICLDAATGKCRWRTQLPVAINAWAVGDADGDGLDEIGLACMDATVKRLDARTGAILWSCDLGPVILPLPYSLGVLYSKAPDGVRGFSASSYYHMSAVSLDGVLLNPKQKVLPGMWLYDCMGGVDLNGDGHGDAISRALWGHVNLYDGKTGMVDYFANIRGRLADWRVVRDTPDGLPDLLVLARGGMGCYNADIRPELLCVGFDGAPDEDALLLEPRSQRTIWQHPWHSCAVALVAWDGDWIVGFATGIIARHARDGRALSRVNTGRPLVDMAVVRIGGTDRLAVNNGASIAVYDREWRLLDERVLANTGMRVESASGRILAFQPDGGVACVDLAREGVCANIMGGTQN